MFEIKSQNTNPVGGSNCSSFGASKFQPNQKTVHVAMRRKKPIVPTCSVIKTANSSSFVLALDISLLMLRSGFRSATTSATAGGFDILIFIKAPHFETPESNSITQSQDRQAGAFIAKAPRPAIRFPADDCCFLLRPKHAEARDAGLREVDRTVGGLGHRRVRED